MSDNSFDLKPICDLRGFRFFVDDYQRGYKWTSLQVLDLLNDIDDFKIEQGIYCLQPIVTKGILPNPSLNFELIDGQQRMTTIYLILSVINNESDFFTIDYSTRENSKHFINNISDISQYLSDVELLENTLELQKNINLKWEEYISTEETAKLNNVDNYHFFMALQIIKLWFSSKSDDSKAYFEKKLLEHTNVIWYEVEQEEKSKRVFKNINSGKIQLTNAELIKALFLISSKDESNKELSEYKQNEIALEWDRIEYSLQNDEFWYFINDEPEKEDKATRIDFLFDLIQDKRANEKDNYYSYRKYALQFKKGANLDWQKVKNLFETLSEWFEDRTLYHYIGFIISQKMTNIPSLLKMNSNKQKKDFEKELIEIIKVKFKTEKEKKNVYYIDNLDYKETYPETLSVLLLFNIETYQTSDANFRFPFDRFKKEKWSIEHIHAQNSEQFTKNKELKDWTVDMVCLIDDLQRNIDKEEDSKAASLKEKLNELIIDINDEEITKENKGKLKELSDELFSYLNMHSISNLALLDGNTNSSIGNSNFLQKREDILNIDKLGWAEINGRRRKAFVPICTKNVFLKYYTHKIEQMTFWGYQDRLHYNEAITEKLNKFYK